MSSPEPPNGARSSSTRPSTPRHRDPVVIGALVVAFVLGGLLAPGIARAVSNIVSGSPVVTPPPAAPGDSLTQAEIDAVALGTPALWLGRTGPQFAVEVSAPTLDRDLVVARVLVTGVDDDGLPVATGSDAVYLAGGESAWVVGRLRFDDDVPPDREVADLTTELHVNETKLTDPGLRVISHEVDDASSPVRVDVVVGSTSTELVSARAVVVVRDAEGELVTVGSRAASQVSSAREESIAVELHDIDALPDGYSLEVSAARW